MTEERMALIELVEKQADSDLVREMLALAAERIMEAEIEARTGAARSARTPMREVRRNGHRDRNRDTRAGRVALEILKRRKGSHFPSFLEPRRTAGKALGDPGSLCPRRLYAISRSTTARLRAMLRRWPAAHGHIIHINPLTLLISRHLGNIHLRSSLDKWMTERDIARMHRELAHKPVHYAPEAEQ